jgi:hypothetical protein
LAAANGHIRAGTSTGSARCGGRNAHFNVGAGCRSIGPITLRGSERPCPLFQVRAGFGVLLEHLRGELFHFIRLGLLRGELGQFCLVATERQLHGRDLLIAARELSAGSRRFTASGRLSRIAQTWRWLARWGWLAAGHGFAAFLGNRDRGGDGDRSGDDPSCELPHDNTPERMRGKGGNATASAGGRIDGRADPLPLTPKETRTFSAASAAA